MRPYLQTCIILSLPFSVVLLAIVAIGGEQGKATTRPPAKASKPLTDETKQIKTARNFWLWYFLDNKDHASDRLVDPFVKAVLASKVPSVEAAERLASEARRKATGDKNSEKCFVVGLIQSGLAIPGYGSVGDYIWIVRFAEKSQTDGSMTQEAWVNSTTGEMRWIFPQ